LQKKIWKELSKIKYGKVSTYGEIAKKLVRLQDM
jgi:O6-methylguanine-DNA--protein-cysteine methyltransferase